MPIVHSSIMTIKIGGWEASTQLRTPDVEPRSSSDTLVLLMHNTNWTQSTTLVVMETFMPTRLAAWTLTWGMMGAYIPRWCHSGWRGHPASPPAHPSARPHSLSNQRSLKRLRKKEQSQYKTVPCPQEALVPEQIEGFWLFYSAMS